MIKCEVIEYFTLKKFNELENIVRANENNNTKDGELFVGDTFDCTKEMADYLKGNNDRGMVVVKVVGEVEEPFIEKIETPEITIEVVDEEEKPKKKKHGKK